MDFLEYSDISAEIKGSLTPGKLKMTDQSIIFKNSKTGKVDQVPASEFEAVNFQNFAGSWGIRVFLKNGTLHRYAGFKESEKEKIAKFFSNSYKIDMLEKELSLKGWNWGTAKFSGSVLSFDIGDKSAFEVPLNHVSQCTVGKNEITMEFHQNDDAPVSLMEMRFFIPASELAGDTDPVEAFQEQVMSKASVISISGDAIAIFRDLLCTTPRGRYDIKLYQSFFQLHGKTFDYKIPITTVLRLFILPHRDGRQMFFVVSLDPPIKQGQTRYHFIVFLFNQEDETSLELPFTEEELKEKYEGNLEKEVSGPTYQVLGKIMKHVVGRKLTGPGSFIGHSGTPAIGCSFKAAAGFLYPLERGFIYVHKPPLHIRFEEIASVNFARGGGSTRSFDFEIELKSGTVHTFSSIEKEEYSKLYDFITSKKLNIKNRGKGDKASYKDDFGNSDEEAAPDAYLERVKAEGQERDEDDDDDDDDESTDEDFDPDAIKKRDSDVAEEFDSNPSSSASDEDEDASDEGERKEKKKKEKKKKPTKAPSSKPIKRREKKEKDENKPKRASTAFMIWLNASREQIKKDNPGIKVTEIAKKGGEMWREMKDKSEWEKKAAKEKEEYTKAMAEYVASGGGADAKSSSSKSATSKKPAKKSATKVPELSNSGTFKSKEFIEESDSSSDEDKKKKPVKDNKKADAGDKNAKGTKRKKESDDEKDTKKAPKKPDSKSKSKKKESDEELEDEEEILSSPEASDASGDDESD
ncbi:FACT complex subunit Ssrp1 [Dendroctonus ponderosae]|uniref:FACT complex subunit Ssrp1 n=1 Tax=Dendroctonus ponderosae TaxID=77166 RepID=UPI00203544D9|nr:FACT complex subunit Ssrp1 [Dendroctonus ponderosae]KAH1024293.1 hypothetical protein HUJ05_003796 [Dendroctonus ponderosae]